jgi:hypothetical protein
VKTYCKRALLGGAMSFAQALMMMTAAVKHGFNFAAANQSSVIKMHHSIK